LLFTPDRFSWHSEIRVKSCGEDHFYSWSVKKDNCGSREWMKFNKQIHNLWPKQKGIILKKKIILTHQTQRMNLDCGLRFFEVSWTLGRPGALSLQSFCRVAEALEARQKGFSLQSLTRRFLPDRFAAHLQITPRNLIRIGTALKCNSQNSLYSKTLTQYSVAYSSCKTENDLPLANTIRFYIPPGYRSVYFNSNRSANESKLNNVVID